MLKYKLFWGVVMFTSIAGLGVAKPIQTERQLLQKVLKEQWVKPVEGEITNPFGNGYHFFNSYRAGHTGIDIRAQVGTPVVAVADGVVTYIRPQNNLRYGRYVVLKHPSGFHTLYGHLQSFQVKPNQAVRKGEIIGLVGVTGASGVPHLFPHLHFEVLNTTPIRDGAYGYYYICKLAPQPFFPQPSLPSMTPTPKTPKIPSGAYEYPHNTFQKKPREHFVFNNSNLKSGGREQPQEEESKSAAYSFNQIRRHYNFLNTYKREMTHIMRHQFGHCQPVKLDEPLTYYNPERLLPPYKHTHLYTHPPK